MQKDFKKTIAKPLLSSKKQLTAEELELKNARQLKHIQDNYKQKELLADIKAKELDEKDFKW